jgi:hypothetical protein
MLWWFIFSWLVTSYKLKIQVFKFSHLSLLSLVTSYRRSQCTSKVALCSRQQTSVQSWPHKHFRDSHTLGQCLLALPVISSNTLLVNASTNTAPCSARTSCLTRLQRLGMDVSCQGVSWCPWADPWWCSVWAQRCRRSLTERCRQEKHADTKPTELCQLRVVCQCS